MRIKAIIIFAAILAPICASGQRGLPNLTGSRGGSQSGPRKAAAKPDPYTYGALPQPKPEQPGAQRTVQQQPGLLNPYFTQPVQPPPTGSKPGSLALPYLVSQPNGMAVLSPQSLYAAPSELIDTNGQQIHPGQPGAGPQGASSRFLEPAPSPRLGFARPEFVQAGLRTIITPTILGYTEDVEPQYYGKEPEQAGASLPSFAALGGESLALKPMQSEEPRTTSLALRELEYGPIDQVAPSDLFRLGSGIMSTRVIPWRAATNMPQAAVDTGSGFRLPRALQGLMNTNIHFGFGIPNLVPNIGSLTNSYLGLGGLTNYLSPDVADRLQGPYRTPSPQR